jgi:hypothetical protein
MAHGWLLPRSGSGIAGGRHWHRRPSGCSWGAPDTMLLLLLPLPPLLLLWAHPACAGAVDPPCGSLAGCSSGYAAPPRGDCRCAAGDVELGIDYMGNDIGGEHHGIRTVQSCCELCAATAGCTWFQQGTGAAENICWMKTKGGAGGGLPSQKQPRIGASVAAAFRSSGPYYCHVGLGAQFCMALFGVASMYLVGGIAYGVRVQGKPCALPAAHPHAEQWRELHALVMDGVAFARGRRRPGPALSQPSAVCAPLVSSRDEGGRTIAGGSSKQKRTKKQRGNMEKNQRESRERQQEGSSSSSGRGGEHDTRTTSSAGGGRWVRVPD